MNEKVVKEMLGIYTDILTEVLKQTNELTKKVETLEKQMSKSWNESGRQKQQIYEIVADVEAVTKKVNRLSQTNAIQTDDELRKSLREAFMNGDVVIKKIF